MARHGIGVRAVQAQIAELDAERCYGAGDREPSAPPGSEETSDPDNRHHPEAQQDDPCGERLQNLPHEVVLQEEVKPAPQTRQCGDRRRRRDTGMRSLEKLKKAPLCRSQ